MSSFQFTAYLTVPQPLLAQLQSAVFSFQIVLFFEALPDFKRVSPRVIRSPENGRITPVGVLREIKKSGRKSRLSGINKARGTLET